MMFIKRAHCLSFAPGPIISGPALAELSPGTRTTFLVATVVVFATPSRNFATSAFFLVELQARRRRRGFFFLQSLSSFATTDMKKCYNELHSFLLEPVNHWCGGAASMTKNATMAGTSVSVGSARKHW